MFGNLTDQGHIRMQTLANNMVNRLHVGRDKLTDSGYGQSIDNRWEIK
jgi:hypothetical protein